MKNLDVLGVAAGPCLPAGRLPAAASHFSGGSHPEKWEPCFRVTHRVLKKSFFTFLWVVGVMIQTAVVHAEDVRIRAEYRYPSNIHQNYLQPSKGMLTHEEFLTIPDGQETRLSVAQQTDDLEWYYDYLHPAHPEISEPPVSVENHLLLKARVTGEEVELTLAPEIVYKTGNKDMVLRLSELSMTKIVFFGDTVILGDGKLSSEWDRHFYRLETGDIVEILLTPHRDLLKKE